MHLNQVIVALSALLPLIDATAHVQPLSTLRQTNRVKQVPGGLKPPGPVALAQVFAKYKKQAPPHVLAAASAALTAATTTTTTATSTKTVSTAAVTATNGVNDIAYYVNITVGKNVMLMDFDTGSSDLWVFSTELPTAQRGSHHLYTPSKVTDSGATSWSISYGDGSSASGNIFVDSVSIGGLVAPVIDVEAAQSVSASFTAGKPDGLVGLGFIEGNQCSPNSCYGFMHQAGPSMPKLIFTATLRHGKPGEYDFGFIDSTKYTGTLSYTNIADFQGAGYWEFLADGYSIGSGAEVTGSIDAIADTGTSLLVADDAVVDAFYAPVTGAVYNSTQAAIIFPCANAAQLPELSFYMNGAKRTMPGSYGNYRTLTSPAGYCYGGVQSNGGSGLTIIGDVFLKSQFVVFDVCLERIGWAQQAGVTV